ncbi:unnamed protein product [Closterium sp. NIES-54]
MSSPGRANSRCNPTPSKHQFSPPSSPSNGKLHQTRRFKSSASPSFASLGLPRCFSVNLAIAVATILLLLVVPHTIAVKRAPSRKPPSRAELLQTELLTAFKDLDKKYPFFFRFFATFLHCGQGQTYIPGGSLHDPCSVQYWQSVHEEDVGGFHSPAEARESSARIGFYQLYPCGSSPP